MAAFTGGEAVSHVDLCYLSLAAWWGGMAIFFRDSSLRTMYVGLAGLEACRALDMESFPVALVIAACVGAFLVGLRLGAPPLHPRPRGRVGEL